MRMWESWKVARDDVHLGVEIALGPADPSDIDVIYVVGIDEQVDPAPLFHAHAASGRLAAMLRGRPCLENRALRAERFAWGDVVSQTPPGKGYEPLLRGHGLLVLLVCHRDEP